MPNTWADSVKAYVLAEKRQYSEALALIGPVVEEPADFWYLDLRARFFRMLGEQKRAVEDYQTLWSHYDASSFRDQVTFGVSAYYVGEIDRAIKILGDYVATSDDVSGFWYLGACHLLRNNLQEGEEHLARSIAVTKNTRELDDILVEELPTLEVTSKGWSHRSQVVGTFQRIRDQITARRVKLRIPRSPENELKRTIEHPAVADAPDSWPWIAAQAALGRLYTEAGQHDAAATTYRKLSKYRERFPEASIGLQRIAAKFEMEGDRLLKAGDPGSAIGQFRGCLDILSDDTPEGLAGQATLRMRLGLAYMLASDPGKARSEFRSALELNRKVGTAHPGLALGETCRQLLGDPKEYWALDDEWNSWSRDVKSETLNNDLAAARESLTEFLVDWLEKSVEGSPGLRIPVVTPILMEIGSGLIAKDTGEDWTLWKFISDMRSRCENQIGVTVPGVRVRRNDALSRDDYALLLDEDWVAGGHTHLEMRYCPAAPGVLQGLGIPIEALVSVANPLTGQQGCWVPPQYWQLITSPNIELWDEPLVFVVNHLEAELRRSLADFLGIQEVENMLENWGKNKGDSALIQQVLSDETARMRFARLLRTLVREQVPITSWKEILASAQDSGLVNLANAVRAARLRLKRELPGNAPDIRRFELPAEWADTVDSWLKYSDGTTCFAPPGEQVHRFLVMLADLLRSDVTHTALVVDNPDVRPYVRRLVEWRFPYVMVLSKEEILSQATSGSPAV